MGSSPRARARVAVVDDLSLGPRVEPRGRAWPRGGDASTASTRAIRQGLQAPRRRDGTYDLCFNLAVIPLPHSLLYPRENVDRNIAMTTAVCELGRAGERSNDWCSSPPRRSTDRAGSRRSVRTIRWTPHTPYAAAKAGDRPRGARATARPSMDVIVVRPFNTYGERQNDRAYAGLIPDRGPPRAGRSSRSSSTVTASRPAT